MLPEKAILAGWSTILRFSFKPVFAIQRVKCTVPVSSHSKRSVFILKCVQLNCDIVRYFDEDIRRIVRIVVSQINFDHDSFLSGSVSSGETERDSGGERIRKVCLHTKKASYTDARPCMTLCMKFPNVDYTFGSELLPHLHHSRESGYDNDCR